MEHASDILGELRDGDENYYRYVGWNGGDDQIKKYFSDGTVRIISAKIIDLLQGVDPQGRTIIVPDKTILSVMNDIYESYRPPVGDIHTRYIVPTGSLYRDNYIQNMIDQTIEVITSDVRNTIGIEENNKKLTVWTTVYGDFNRHGLQQTSQIKIRNKHPAHFQFHMRY